ncbi:hypothetical protein ACFYNO_34855 [Kitasatospora sp. NPDC006697]|uniref:hypothetical protein n=1 Tax=Kitasatospora sp. NPDC006697 TaxID=3364020 RepID=UPI00369FA1CB
MDREKIPRVIEGTETFVLDPEDEDQECTRPCCRAEPGPEGPDHWGHWLKPPA